MPNLMQYDPFGMVLVVFPVATLALSFVLQLIIRKKVIIIAAVFVGYLIATFTAFNSSFLIWCFVYAVLAAIGTILADVCRKLFRRLFRKTDSAAGNGGGPPGNETETAERK